MFNLDITNIVRKKDIENQTLPFMAQRVAIAVGWPFRVFCYGL